MRIKVYAVRINAAFIPLEHANNTAIMREALAAMLNTNVSISFGSGRCSGGRIWRPLLKSAVDNLAQVVYNTLNLQKDIIRLQPYYALFSFCPKGRKEGNIK